MILEIPTCLGLPAYRQNLKIANPPKTVIPRTASSTIVSLKMTNRKIVIPNYSGLTAYYLQSSTIVSLKMTNRKIVIRLRIASPNYSGLTAYYLQSSTIVSLKMTSPTTEIRLRIASPS